MKAIINAEERTLDIIDQIIYVNDPQKGTVQEFTVRDNLGNIYTITILMTFGQ